ncbi:MAG TPA: DUF2179 domain-containing protein [bacterium]|nr:DUF2179 domain-containing protein [bacterium]
MIYDLPAHFSPEIWRWLIMPLIIMCLRICDVSMDTVRIIFINRGLKVLASAIGFVQVLIWLFTITRIVQNLAEVQYYIAYAAGFAAGNYLGIFLESKLAIGLLAVRVITRKDATELVNFLQAEEFGYTSIAARGTGGEARLLFSIIKRKDLERVMEIIHRFNPKAFVSVEDVRAASEGIFPSRRLKNGVIGPGTLRR